MVIVEENQEYSEVVGSSSAPFLNALAGGRGCPADAACVSATSWYGLQHDSAGDYLGFISGSTWGFGTSIWATLKHPLPYPTLVDEFPAGTTWKAYLESLPQAGGPCNQDGNGLYEKTHNPFAYFASTTASSSCAPYSPAVFGADMASKTPPNFVWVTPNVCDDMHGTDLTGQPCSGFSKDQLIQSGDRWLQGLLTDPINGVFAADWWAGGAVVIVTWDEGTTNNGLPGGAEPPACAKTAPPVPGTCGGNIMALVISNLGDEVVSGRFTSSGDHYGTLKAIEEYYDVKQLQNSASSVDGDLRGAW